MLLRNTALARPESIAMHPVMQNDLEPLPTITRATTLGSIRELRRQQSATYPTVCGYSNGIESSARIAAPGWACTTDEADDLWGFCQTSLYAVNSCTLGGACVDTYSCTSGCGLSGNAVSTFTCPNSSPYCTNAYLTVGDTQLFTYLGCGVTAAQEHLLAQFTTATTATTSSSSSKASSTTIVPFATATTPLSSSTTNSATSFQSATSSTNPTTIGSAYSATSASASGATLPTASSNNIGAIVGGSIGGVALISLVALAIYFLKRRRVVFNDNNHEIKGTVHGPAANSQPWNELEGNSMRPPGGTHPSELDGNPQLHYAKGP